METNAPSGDETNHFKPFRLRLAGFLIDEEIGLVARSSVSPLASGSNLAAQATTVQLR
jgi:hypothetical protein